MHEHRLPVLGATSDGKPVAIREIALGHLIQFAGWDNFEAVANERLAALGLRLPNDYRTPATQGGVTAMRVAPDRVLVRSQALPDLASSDDIAALDLSQARVGLELVGAGAADLLSRVMALDFAEGAFPVGAFMQGSVHHVGVLVERRERDAFEMLVPTTWAVSLIELLADHIRKAAA